MVATVCRKAAKMIVEKRGMGNTGAEAPSAEATAAPAKKSKKAVAAAPTPTIDMSGVKMDAGDLEELLGPARYTFGKVEEHNEVGLTNGLAYTEAGGDLLQIEVSVLPGKGQVKITGKLGEVMQESAATAMSYVRSRAEQLGLKEDFHQNVDIHLHVPEGAVPKDGPSAGITMATAITSALTKIPVKRDVAMTGEITLRGRVLAIGGLKEKILAAKIGNIQTVLIPKENVPDLKKIPKGITQGLRIIPVEHADQVLRIALDLPNPEEFLVKQGPNIPTNIMATPLDLNRDEPAKGRTGAIKH
jgi:ATP-dependent Lon protease